MELTNEFRVSAPIERAWEVFKDAEVIAPCMPGAQLVEVEGDVYHGVVKVKVGPIAAQYKGTAIYTTVDEAARRIVVTAEGRETRGQGNANATVTAEMAADGDGTTVRVVTDLTITGRVAQFGRGVLADVSARLLGQFVDCLEASVLAAGSARGAGQNAPGGGAGSSMAPEGGRANRPAGPGGARGNGMAGPGEGPRVRAVEQREVEPIDLLEVAGAPVARRIVPLVAGVLAALFLLRRRRRRRKGSRGSRGGSGQA